MKTTWQHYLCPAHRGHRFLSLSRTLSTGLVLREFVTKAMLIGLFACVGGEGIGLVHAAVITASTPSRADVVAAIATANDGDTVRIPAGTATWNRVVHVTKAISIIGAGVGRTIILDDIDRTLAPEGLATGESVWSIATVSGRFYRISGMTFRDAATRSTVYANGLIQITGSASAIRLDHIQFDFPSGSKHSRFVYWFNYARGVMDNVDFNMTGEQAFTVFHDRWGGGTEGNGSWEASDMAGTAEMVYVEDCRILGTDDGGMTDGFSGARFCVRYCTLRNGHIATHGTESTGRHRGTRWVEVYNNRFEHPISGSNAYGIDYRSGSGVVFGNVGIGGHQNPVHMSNYRDIDHFIPWGMADGRNPFDRNDNNGGTGNPFESGFHSGPNGAVTVTDSTKSWAINQWAGAHVHRVGIEGVASPGSGLGTLLVAGASWTPNQWKSWTVMNLNTGRTRLVIANTADTISFSGDGIWPFAPGEGYVVYFPRHIQSNTANTLTLSGSAFGEPNMAINAGDQYRIFRTIEPLDMPGMGRSTGFVGTAVPSPVAWPNQATTPLYEWNNSFEGQLAGVVGARPPILSGVHYILNTPKPGYTPYTYPHPLRRPSVPTGLDF